MVNVKCYSIFSFHIFETKLAFCKQHKPELQLRFPLSCSSKGLLCFIFAVCFKSYVASKPVLSLNLCKTVKAYLKKKKKNSVNLYLCGEKKN